VEHHEMKDCAATSHLEQALLLPLSINMDNIQEIEAVTAVLDDAGARTCVGCGERAAVRTLVPIEEGFEVIGNIGLSAEAQDAFVWFCFECGHEERVAH
jgi:hypothetical protein